MSGSNKKINNNEFPPQKGPYKVRVKNGAEWRTFDSCRLQVSVGNPKHEGEKFSATLNWALERFSSVTVCVNDTLQRFNLTRDKKLPASLARAESQQLGDQWILNNMAPAKPQIKLCRWDEWLNTHTYAGYYQLFNTLFESTNTVFRSSIDEEISFFASRRGVSVDNDYYELCRQFLIEESAVFATMIAHQEAVDIYPGTTLLPLRLIQSGQIPKIELRNRAHFTRIDFTHQQNVRQPLASL
jgi:tRNA-dependent cyclodipeptide synthase